MLKVNYSYSDKSFILSPYNTAKEKDLLLLGTIAEESLDAALDICEFTGNELTDDEKFAILYKFREISVGAEINVTFKCVHCNTTNENIVDISDITEDSEITNPNITDAYKIVTDNNIHEFVDVNIQELDIDQYNNLFSEIQNTCTKFIFVKTVHCQKCTKINTIDLRKKKLTIDILSDDSLVSIYQTYNDLIFFGNYSKLDIDSMYPFERTIFFSLLNKTRESINK